MDKKTLRKQEIIEKSISRMFEYGYHGTSVKDIADAAGIPKGSVYNYFENKEDYVVEALKYYGQQAEPLMSNLTNTSLGPIERIERFYTLAIQGHIEYQTYSLGCFTGKMAQELCGINAGIRGLVEDLHDKVAGKIASNIEEAISLGLLETKMPAKELADFIHSSWHGTLLRVKSTQDKETLNNFYNIVFKVLLK